MQTTTSRLSTAPLSAVLPATDITRAAHFYEHVLGLHTEPAPLGGYVFVHGGSGTRVLVYETAAPHGEATAASFLVDDIESTVRELRGRGVVFEEYDMPGLRTVNGIADIGPMGRAAWFKDSEGNTLSIAKM
jgi:predicted enzyme related to lactoylglutathione lyase